MMMRLRQRNVRSASLTTGRLARDGRSGSGGFTLIEILLVFSLLGSLLGGTIGLIRVIRQSNQNAQQNLVMRQEIRRFANDLRRNVGSANQVRIEDGKLVATVASPQSSTIYQTTPDHVERITHFDPEPNAGSVTRSIERYVVGSRLSSQLELVNEPVGVRWTFTQDDRPDEPIEIIAYSKRTP